MIEQHHETARANALDEQLAQEQRRRILAGWAENKAIMRDRYKTQMACVAPKIEETDDE
jgi:hypothetical protein